MAREILPLSLQNAGLNLGTNTQAAQTNTLSAEQLLQQLLSGGAPDVAPVEPERLPIPEMILRALADVVGSGSLGAGTSLPDEIARRREEAAFETERLQRRGQRQFAQRVAGAEVGLRGAQRAEDTARGLEAEERGAVRSAAETAEQRRFRSAELQDRRKFDAEQAAIQRRFEKELAELRAAGRDPSGFGKLQQEALGNFRIGANALIEGLAEELKTKTPEQIRAEMERNMDVLGLQGAARDQAELFMLKHLEPLLQAAEEQAAAAAVRPDRTAIRPNLPDPVTDPGASRGGFLGDILTPEGQARAERGRQFLQSEASPNADLGLLELLLGAPRPGP